MRCPICKSDKIKIIDTKKFDTVVFRVRLCESCHHPFKTEENIELITPVRIEITSTSSK